MTVRSMQVLALGAKGSAGKLRVRSVAPTGTALSAQLEDLFGRALNARSSDAFIASVRKDVSRVAPRNGPNPEVYTFTWEPKGSPKSFSFIVRKAPSGTVRINWDRAPMDAVLPCDSERSLAEDYAKAWITKHGRATALRKACALQNTLVEVMSRIAAASNAVMADYTA